MQPGEHYQGKGSFQIPTMSSLLQESVVLGHHMRLPGKWSPGEPGYQGQIRPVCWEVSSWFLVLYLDTAGNGGKTEGDTHWKNGEEEETEKRGYGIDDLRALPITQQPDFQDRAQLIVSTVKWWCEWYYTDHVDDIQALL